MQEEQPYGYQTYDDEAYPEDEEPLIYGDEPNTNPRRGQAATVMVLAGLFFIFSLFVLATFNIESGALAGAFDFWSLGVWSVIFFAIMMVFFIWLLALLLAESPRPDEDWYADEAEEPPTAEYGEPGAPDTITLRCPRCVNIFSLQDPWTRPFYHVCPHCEVRGVYTGVQDPPEVKAALERQGHGGHAA